MIEINALDALSLRKTDIIPIHFSKMKLSEKEIYNNSIEDWIKAKLKGRYFIKKYPSIDNDGKFKSSIFVGFEIQSELTHFILACPHLRRN
jgi:hypothetical protein